MRIVCIKAPRFISGLLRRCTGRRCDNCGRSRRRRNRFR